MRLFCRGGGCYALSLSVSLSFSPRTKDDVDAERGGRCGRDFRKRWYRVFRRGKRVCECVCVLFWFLGKRSFFQSVSLSLFLFVRVYYIYLYSLSVLVCDRGVRDMVRNEIPPPKRRKRRETTEMSRTTTSTTRPVRVKTTKKSTRKRRNGIKS